MVSILKDIMHGVDKASSLIDRIPEGVDRATATIQGRLHPNHRHDEPHEQAEDRIRAEIRAQHRFDSFAGERMGNTVKWHVDGHDYFFAVSEILDKARECIFIQDWWLSPELYLRKPPAYHPEWRLDKLLKRKAEQGVKIYVIVYKEVTQSMSLSSSHTKHALEDLHPNIACMRHPDHIGSKDDVEFWSHHEKVVVVDNHRACIGGLDLCFGRWDTHNHPLADVHPTDWSKTLFAGQDYNNARVLDFQNVDRWTSNAISIMESPRMPWHDVHMSLTGPVVLDIVQHFVERWNEVKKRKYKTDTHYDWLALPHNVQIAPNEPVARHPHREQWHTMGRQFAERFISNDMRVSEPDPTVYPAPRGSCRVQVVRSVGDWSHGVLTEHSIQNAYIGLISKAEHYIYIENQFFISNTRGEGLVKNQIARALAQRIIDAAQNHQKFKVVVVIPEVPGFAGDIKSTSSIKYIMAGQYRTMNRGGNSIYELIRQAGYDPEQYIRFYHLRTYDRINAPYQSFIKQMERNSGVAFHQAQVALARQWVGNPNVFADKNPKAPREIKTVCIKKPDPSTEGIFVTPKTEVKTEEVPLPPNEDAARQIIERFEDGALHMRGDDDVADTVGQHRLQDRTGLLDEAWLGTEEEERQAYVSELEYIHSKLMIVDDKVVIMGSANLNDRSQCGDRDSEIALVVEDQYMIPSRMNGHSYKASRFAATLRRQLYREHLGLIRPQSCSKHLETITDAMRPAPIDIEYEFGTREDQLVEDPLSDQTVNLFESTAKHNRNVFTEVFRPLPSNLVTSWSAYSSYVPNVKTGHVVPEISLQRVKQQLATIRGSLVECPMNFLRDEKEFTEGPEWLGLNPTMRIYL